MKAERICYSAGINEKECSRKLCWSKEKDTQWPPGSPQKNTGNCVLKKTKIKIDNAIVNTEEFNISLPVTDKKNWKWVKI